MMQVYIRCSLRITFVVDTKSKAAYSSIPVLKHFENQVFPSKSTLFNGETLIFETHSRLNRNTFTPKAISPNCKAAITTLVICDLSGHKMFIFPILSKIGGSVEAVWNLRATMGLRGFN